MKIKIEPGSFLYRCLISVLSILIKIWFKTLRVSRKDALGLTNGINAGNYAVAMWHNRILGAVPLFHSKFRKNTVAIASRSKDGQMITDFLEKFKIETIRGSSNKEGKNKGGARALIQSIVELRKGHNICFTVDGPRGPIYESKPGVLKASQKSGIEILPISVNMNSYWQMKSWDKLQVPKPFSKVEMIIGEPISITKDCTAEQMKAHLENLNKTLMEITVDKK